VVEERRPRDRAQYDRFLDDVETSTIQSLLAANQGEPGIIGRQRLRATKRKAVSVYWTGLGEWGIRVDADMTMGSHREYVLTRHRRSSGLAEGESAQPYQVWDELPLRPDGFPDTPLPILPDKAEAEYLLGRMSGTTAAGLGDRLSTAPSLLAAAALHPHTADAVWPWDLPGSVIPEHLREALHHAEMFSLAIQGARLLYVRLLFRRQAELGLGESPGADDVEGRIDDWLDDMNAKASAVGGWSHSMDDLFGILATYGVAVAEQTRSFVRAWCRAAVADPALALESKASADLLEARERALKGPHARLAGGAALKSWDGAQFGSVPLDYRWSVARRMILDCREGMEAGDAGS
jgi:hypothetical protein